MNLKKLDANYTKCRTSPACCYADIFNMIIGGLAGIGVDNLDKPSQIDRLSDEINDTIYPPIPPESRSLPRTGPSLPSPGYEN